MAQISITVPDDQVARVREAFAKSYGYEATINGQPNPENKIRFTERKLREHIHQVVKAYEANRDAEIARKATMDKVNSEVILS